jgi:hypothetical protein
MTAGLCEELECCRCIALLKADLEAERAKVQRRDAVVEAAREGFVILADLHLVATWELSPYVKKQLERGVSLMRDALAAISAAEPKP